MTGCQMDLTPFTTTLWAQPFSQFFTSEEYTHPNHGLLVSPGGSCGEQCQRPY